MKGDKKAPGKRSKLGRTSERREVVRSPFPVPKRTIDGNVAADVGGTMDDLKKANQNGPDTEEVPQDEEWFRDDRTETTVLYDQDGGAAQGADVTESGVPSEAWGVLHFRNPDGSWVDIPLIDDQLLIGRTDQAQVPLAFDRRVSRVHCILTRTAVGCRLIDRGSENGTYVDDELAEERDLLGGEIIRVGDTSIVFHVLSDPTVPISAHMPN